MDPEFSSVDPHAEINTRNMKDFLSKTMTLCTCSWEGGRWRYRFDNVHDLECYAIYVCSCGVGICIDFVMCKTRSMFIRVVEGVRRI